MLRVNRRGAWGTVIFYICANAYENLLEMFRFLLFLFLDMLKYNFVSAIKIGYPSKSINQAYSSSILYIWVSYMFLRWSKFFLNKIRGPSLKNLNWLVCLDKIEFLKKIQFKIFFKDAFVKQINTQKWLDSTWISQLSVWMKIAIIILNFGFL